MDDFTKNDMEEALKYIASMIGRSEKAQEKFAQGTPQYTLQKNRIKALYIASSLIKKELGQSDDIEHYTEDELEKALAPITSLISKSEKAQMKLTKGTWQHTMLEGNLKALYAALPLIKRSKSYGQENY